MNDRNISKGYTDIRFLIDSIHTMYQISIIGIQIDPLINCIPKYYLQHREEISSTISRYRVKRDSLDVFLIVHMILYRLIEDRETLNLIKRKLFVLTFLFGYSIKESYFLRKFSDYYPKEPIV